jgi:hypothetical protein
MSKKNHGKASPGEMNGSAAVLDAPVPLASDAPASITAQESEAIDNALETATGPEVEFVEEQTNPAELPVSSEEEAKRVIAAKKAAEEKAVADKDAMRHLNHGVQLYEKGEKAMREGRLFAGREFWEYVRNRIAIGVKRSVAINAIVSRIQPLSSDMVGQQTVSDMMKAYHAYRLLAEERGRVKDCKDVPYFHWHACFTTLVESKGENTAEETYVLLPGAEAECASCYDSVVDLGHDRDNARFACLNVRSEWNERRLAHERHEKEAKQRESIERQAEADKEKLAREVADREAREAEAEAKRQAAEAEAKKTEESRKLAELGRIAAEAARKQADDTASRAMLAAQHLARAKEEERQADKRIAEAEAKKANLAATTDRLAARMRGETPQRRKPEEPDTNGKALPPSAWADKDVKDVAEHLASIVFAHKTPNVLVERLLELFSASKALTGRIRKGCDSALDHIRKATDEGPSK